MRRLKNFAWPLPFHNKPNAKTFIGMGALSVNDFLYFHDDMAKSIGIPTRTVEIILEEMVNHGIISPLNSLMNGVGTSDLRYRPAGPRCLFLYKRGLILNTLCGWNYIVQRYSASVLKIEHINPQGDPSVGTGFYFAAGNNEFVKYMIVTNKHVLENAKQINLFDKNDARVEYQSYVTDLSRDLGFILLNGPLDVPYFEFNQSKEVLTEIITIGFPSIPMTKFAYQVYHKGEINSFVEDYSGQELFLFSAKTSSGNSGSPIIDKYGMILGIVTEELFEKKQFYEKGKLPYYAGIPANEIIASMNEIIFTGTP